MKTAFQYISVLLFYTTFSSYMAKADFQAGLDAINAKDFVTAIKELRPEAEQGNVDAQYMLGVLYDSGEGVLEDDVEAVKWYRLAAEQGHTASQYMLGFQTAIGKGTQKDFVNAYMWINLAAAKGDEDAVIAKKTLQERMTQDQIQKAQKLSREWFEKHQ